MGAKFRSQFIVNAQLVYLANRARNINGYQNINYSREFAYGNGGAALIFGHGMSMASWGEEITVTLVPYSANQTIVDIFSKCSLPTQLIDYGKNASNVRTMQAYLLSGLMIQPVPKPYWNNNVPMK